MALLLKNGAVFLHIPRTGGNWTTMALDELNLIERRIDHKHADLRHFYAQRILDSNPFTFCFIRHPLTWYESWFRYMSSTGWPCFDSLHPNMLLNGLGDKDFNKFIAGVLAIKLGYVSELYGGYMPVSFIGKQENLVNDFITVLRLMGLEPDEDCIRSFGRIGASSEMPVIWDEGLKAQVLAYENPGRYGYA